MRVHCFWNASMLLFTYWIRHGDGFNKLSAYTCNLCEMWSEHEQKLVFLQETQSDLGSQMGSEQQANAGGAAGQGKRTGTRLSNHSSLSRGRRTSVSSLPASLINLGEVSCSFCFSRLITILILPLKWINVLSIYSSCFVTSRRYMHVTLAFTIFFKCVIFLAVFRTCT